jgi:hypothetical protein
VENENQKLKEEITDEKQTKDRIEDLKEYGKLVIKIEVDTDRIKKDEEEILRTKGNIAVWEKEIADHNKVKEKSLKDLIKLEEAQKQSVDKNGKKNEATEINILALKKDIANQETLIALKQAKINEEGQKNSDKTISKLEKQSKKTLEQNRAFAEQEAIRAEIALIESGSFEDEKQKNSFLY